MNKITNQDRMMFAQGNSAFIALDILRRVCQSSSKHTIIGNNEFTTILNAITLDTETALMNNFIREVEEIKKGKMYEEEINNIINQN